MMKIKGKKIKKLTHNKKTNKDNFLYLFLALTVCCSIMLMTIRNNKVFSIEKIDTMRIGDNAEIDINGGNSIDNIKYVSSNTGVAIVDDSGIITALSPGKTTITASSGNKKAKIVVKVSDDELSKAEIGKIKTSKRVKFYKNNKESYYNSTNAEILMPENYKKAKYQVLNEGGNLIKSGTVTYSNNKYMVNNLNKAANNTKLPDGLYTLKIKFYRVQNNKTISFSSSPNFIIDTKAPTSKILVKNKETGNYVEWTNNKIVYREDEMEVRVQCFDDFGTGCRESIIDKKFQKVTQKDVDEKNDSSKVNSRNDKIAATATTKKYVRITDKAGNYKDVEIIFYIQERILNTVQDLKKLDTKYIRRGDRIIVKGYNTYGDGGESMWQITQGNAKTSNDIDIIKLKSNSSVKSGKELQAKLVVNNSRINVLQLGVKRGLNANTSDNTKIIQRAISLSRSNNSSIYFPKGYYLVGNLKLGEFKTITFEGEKPIDRNTYESNNDNLHSILVFNGTKGKGNPMLKQRGGVTILKNLAFYGSVPGKYSNPFDSSSYFEVGGAGGLSNSRPRIFADNCEFSGWKSALGGAHLSGSKVVYDKLDGEKAKNYKHIALLLNDCFFYNNSIAVSQPSDTRISNSHFNNNYVDIAIGNGSGGISIFSSSFSNTKRNAIIIAASTDAYDVQNSKTITNYVKKLSGVNSTMTGPHDITVEGNTFTGESQTAIYIDTTKEVVIAGKKRRINPSGILVLNNKFNGALDNVLPSSTLKEINSNKTRIYVSGCIGCIIGENMEEQPTNISSYLRNDKKLLFNNNFKNSKYYYLTCKDKSTMSKYVKDKSNQAVSNYTGNCNNYGY